MDQKEEEINKYLFWITLIVLIILSYLIIKPYIISLISAFILAYLTRPVFSYLSPKIGKNLSALSCIFLIIIIIILPLGTVITGIIAQAKESISADFIKSTLNSISSYPFIQKLNINLATLSEKGLEILIVLIKFSASTIPSILLSIFITLFGIYYIFVSWDSLAGKLKLYLPFKDKHRVIKEISEITNSLVYGTILLGFIEFLVAATGFFILGVKSYLLLSAIVFLSAFIPLLGPAAVWLPMMVYYLFTQNYFTAIGLLIVGIILSVGIDTFLKIKLLGKKTEINPLVMLIGILGGISLFGIFGFIIGPLILVYAIELIEELIRKR